MSHVLDFSTGRAAIAYTGKTPWHGLGQLLTPDAGLAQWQVEAGLNWACKRADVQYVRHAVDAEGNATDVLTTDPRSDVLYRSDNGMPLHIVSKRYKPVQPREIIEFFRDLTEKHGFRMETAGALDEGRKIWTLANCEKVTKLRGGDALKAYLLAATSFDGSMSTQFRFTSVRVVCNNTLTYATDAGKADVTVRHNTELNVEDVKFKLNVGDAWAEFSESCQRLAGTKVDAAKTVDILMAAYLGADTDEKRAKVRADEKAAKSFERIIARVSAALDSSPGHDMESARGMLWGVLNAVTFDIDHRAPARTQSNRLESAFFGNGETIKNRAMQACLNAAA